MKKRILAFASAVCVLVAMLHGAAFAAGTEAVGGSGLPEEYTNRIEAKMPTVNGVRRTSFVDELSGGGYQSVIYDSGVLYVENFDSKWNSVSQKTVDLELPIWGGVHLGAEYNYVVCGQYRDTAQNDGGEVYRIIKYDKSFRRIGSISFSASETYTAAPFDSGNVSIDEYENILTVYTSRLRLDAHQSNIALCINTDDMTVYSADGTSSFPSMHTSHSFRQIIRFDGETPVYVDLSDSSPARAVYIQYGEMGIPLVAIPGQSGDNITNTEVSGLEISDSHYFVVGSALNYGAQNIFLSCVNKETGEASTRWLTSSTVFAPQTLYAPRVDKISDDRFVVMWNAAETFSLRYLIIDGSGNILCSTKEKAGIQLTDCEPIFSGGKLTWLSVSNGEIKTVSLSDFTQSGTFALVDPIVAPVNPWDGTADTSWYSSTKTEFHISTPQQLAGLSELAAAGNTFANETVYLDNDIFMNDDSYSLAWTPIESWAGTLNGKGHTIYNLYQPDQIGGLINTVEEGGSVKAINLSQGQFFTGGCVADTNEGIIAFCNSYSLVYEDEFSSSIGQGGICNTNQNLVYGCKNYGSVLGGSVAGIVGINQEATSVVSQCANLGMVAGTDSASGIVGNNYGWVYNCYSKGLISGQVPGNMNEAKYLAGITENQGSYRTGDIESCYSLGCFGHMSNGEVLDVYAIAPAGVVNCFTQDRDVLLSGEVSYLTAEQMTDDSFVDLLNRQTNTVLPAWVADTNNINGGYPITVADDNYEKGIYKIQPELWIDYQGTVVMSAEDSIGTICESYYNEEDMVITLSKKGIVNYELSDGYLTISPIKPGETTLNIHFDETENVIAGDYSLKIVVEKEHTPLNGSCSGCGMEMSSIYFADDAINITAPGVEKGGLIITAIYGQDGGLLTCYTASAADDTLVYKLNKLSSAKECQVFILDADFRPLHTPLRLYLD